MSDLVTTQIDSYMKFLSTTVLKISWLVGWGIKIQTLKTHLNFFQALTKTKREKTLIFDKNSDKFNAVVSTILIKAK